MICYCCLRDVLLVCRVQLRCDPREQPAVASPADPAYQAYVNNKTIRTEFICPGCYHALDNDLGLGEIGGKVYNLAGKSRGGKAPEYNRAKWLEHQRSEADKLGIGGDQVAGSQPARLTAPGPSPTVLTCCG
jgi:hypothetical protein